MKIRKEFRVESAHIVRNCTSERCSHSIHGHSAVIEVFLESRSLDNAQMVYDFGLMKGTIKQLVDSMDHCYLLCDKDSDEFKSFIKSSCDRYIVLPFNPSAEMLSVFIHRYISNILSHTVSNNGESTITVSGVRYHETTTGWAESDAADVISLWKPEWDRVVEFSNGVVKDWSDDLKKIIFDGDRVVNPVIDQQIDLSGRGIVFPINYVSTSTK